MRRFADLLDLALSGGILVVSSAAMAWVWVELVAFGAEFSWAAIFGG